MAGGGVALNQMFENQGGSSPLKYGTGGRITGFATGGQVEHPGIRHFDVGGDTTAGVIANSLPTNSSPFADNPNAYNLDGSYDFRGEGDFMGGGFGGGVGGSGGYQGGTDYTVGAGGFTNNNNTGFVVPSDNAVTDYLNLGNFPTPGDGLLLAANTNNTASDAGSGFVMPTTPTAISQVPGVETMVDGDGRTVYLIPGTGGTLPDGTTDLGQTTYNPNLLVGGSTSLEDKPGGTGTNVDNSYLGSINANCLYLK